MSLKKYLYSLDSAELLGQEEFCSTLINDTGNSTPIQQYFKTPDTLLNPSPYIKPKI